MRRAYQNDTVGTDRQAAGTSRMQGRRGRTGILSAQLIYVVVSGACISVKHFIIIRSLFRDRRYLILREVPPFAAPDAGSSFSGPKRIFLRADTTCIRRRRTFSLSDGIFPGDRDLSRKSVRRDLPETSSISADVRAEPSARFPSASKGRSRPTVCFHDVLFRREKLMRRARPSLVIRVRACRGRASRTAKNPRFE